MNALKPIIGDIEPSSISEESGFVKGQEILAINGIKTPTWLTVVDSLVSNIVSENIVSIDVINVDGDKQALNLNLSNISIDEISINLLCEITIIIFN